MSTREAGRPSDDGDPVAVPWTVAQAPDQCGRVAVVTGANRGIGLAIALALAERGATVVLACRHPDRAELARATIREAQPDADVDVVELDLADLASVRRAALRIAELHPRVDLLVNNGAAIVVPPSRSADGYEMQLATNHLGHFALTGLLRDRLVAAEGARVVTMSSLAHGFGKVDVDDLRIDEGAPPWRAYARSKLANLLFAFELQRRLDVAGVDTLSVAAHPGHAATGGDRDDAFWLRPFRSLSDRMGADPAMAALPALRAGLDPGVRGGTYFGPGGRGGRKGPPVRVEPAARALDPAVAARLWDVSEALTGMAEEWAAR